MATPTALKIEKFAREPMESKLVTEVAGVGQVAKLKLRSKGIVTAADLYEKFRRLRYDENRFREWVLKTCPGARVSIIHKSLVAWQEQNELISSASESRASTSRGGRRPAPRPRRSVSSELPSNSRPRTPETNSNQQPNNMDPFIVLISNLLQNIAPDLRTDYMGKVLEITREYETITRNRRADAQMPPPPPRA